MFCSKCGTENQDGTQFCSSCGTALGEKSVEPKPAIWNPNAAANWSILLTPAFGSFVQSKNWKSLNQPGKATSSMVWFFLSLAVIVATLFIPDQYAMAAAFWYLIIWYAFAGRKQGKFVKKEFGDNYEKKSWGKPILLAILAIIVYAVLATMILA